MNYTPEDLLKFIRTDKGQRLIVFYLIITVIYNYFIIYIKTSLGFYKLRGFTDLGILYLRKHVFYSLIFSLCGLLFYNMLPFTKIFNILFQFKADIDQEKLSAELFLK